MPEEGFLRRWARVKASGPEAAAEAPPRPPAPASAAPASAPTPAPAMPWARAGDTLPVPETVDAVPPVDPSGTPARPSPTLDDVAKLTSDSDYSVFVGQGVDKSVQRLALKKLFADPHFNVMDRLDMYMDDYNIPSPVSAEMLASLDHARSALRRVVEEPVAEAQAAELAPSPLAASGDVPLEPAAEAAPPAPVPDTTPNAAIPHNEAAHATAVHEDALPGNTPGAIPSCAPMHEHGPFHRPNQQLPQGQV